MMINAKLGKRKYLGGASFLIPVDMNFEFILTLEEKDCPSLSKTTDFPMILKFNDYADNQSVSFSTIDGKMVMTLHNWNGVATTLNEPFKLIKIETNADVEMMMANSRVGTTNHLSLQFWLNTYEE
ncbi:MULTISPECIES: hypothetical protein [Yersinia]|uniref:Uncharacterized protein n=1 Tax=Yersinia ruckeri TaxID=29486 RepID=A0A380QPP2_YERRU|nr:MULTISPECIES: hypothetical protein [Yersinia]AYW95469.1 hypothetical protein EGX39_06160 [Yersinia pseudotuberculosis]EEP97544.1 hypothetical protein yruck0001_34020 [Yersinia ruckeri ATCC 29473]EKN4695553.1 hypothetical protein [Yersinia ruckeri]KGA43953.1 hypothetical protein DJ39_2529 [Yersinia ruckeri ATCC 29473]MCK8565929.1 hypothetical protein [Yersinia ruckeri]